MSNNELTKDLIDKFNINNVTIHDAFPIPTIDEFFNELLAPHSIPNSTSAQASMRFVFRWNLSRQQLSARVMTTLSSTSCLLAWTLQHSKLQMNTMFKSYLSKFILIFFDDILVYNHVWSSTNYDETSSWLSTRSANSWHRRLAIWGISSLVKVFPSTLLRYRQSSSGYVWITFEHCVASLAWKDSTVGLFVATYGSLHLWHLSYVKIPSFGKQITNIVTPIPKVINLKFSVRSKQDPVGRKTQLSSWKWSRSQCYTWKSTPSSPLVSCL